MNFAWPWCFLLVLPFFAAIWRTLRKGRRGGVPFSAVSSLPAKTAGWRARMAMIAPFLFLAGCALLIVAAARPRRPLAQSNKSVDAIAIAMTVDLSGSMEALDLTPKGANWVTRLDVVKDMFAQFVEARSDDLIGLITFGGYATARTPLTADHAAVLHVLKGLEIPSVRYDSMGKPIDPEETMTAIGDGLAMALARLKDSEVVSKIVILLSDGESNTGAVQPDEAAEAAAKLGIRVYTIGVGTNSSRTPVRVRDIYGRSSIQYANLSFDEKQLKSIASKTNARYFAVNDSDGLKAALEEIDNLEKTTLDRTVYQRYREFFPNFLTPGVLLLLAAVSLQMAASRRLV